MKPPQHRIDAPAVLILRDDPAWDFERVEAELEELGDDSADHPVTAYFRGATRYDTGAVESYLQSDKQPLRINIRRLPVDRLARVQDMFTREVSSDGEVSLYSVWVEAVLGGVVSIEGDGAPELDHRHGKLTAGSLQRIHDELGGLQTISEIGAAVFNLSQPLTAAEKKR